MLRDIAGIVAGGIGALVWILYVVGHCTSAKDSVLQSAPSVLSLLCLTGLTLVIAIVYTRHWAIPVFVAFALILPFYFSLVRATLWYGLRQSLPVICSALLLPVLLIVVGAYCGGRLRSRILPV
jgi:hypothetical protein